MKPEQLKQDIEEKTIVQKQGKMSVKVNGIEVVTLIFTGTPTVKDNTAGSAGFASLFLSGSTDLTAANNTVLCLVYDGTQWQETSRKID